jgi:hypothetical protein
MPSDHRGYGAPSEDLPLFNARRSDPRTSRESAALLRSGRHLQILLACYRAAWPNGLTDEEASRISGLTGGWKRCSDLRRLGCIVPNGETRRAESGRNQMVCVERREP